MQPQTRLVPLQCLRPGQSARVVRVVGQSDHVHRLEEFGLRRNTRIEMFRPGNPCILRLAGHKVCLRVGELLNVLVQPC
jgi:ferrous iron transport protein A